MGLKKASEAGIALAGTKLSASDLQLSRQPIDVVKRFIHHDLKYRIRSPLLSAALCVPISPISPSGYWYLTNEHLQMYTQTCYANTHTITGCYAKWQRAIDLSLYYCPYGQGSTWVSPGCANSNRLCEATPSCNGLPSRLSLPSTRNIKPSSMAVTLSSRTLGSIVHIICSRWTSS